MTWLGVLAALAGLVSPPCLVPPVEAPIVERFRPPACEFCAGHRGIDFAATAGAVVRAAAAGTVTFAGPVAGVTWVVVTHPGDVRTSYGDLGRVEVPVGAEVVAGQVIGVASGPVHLGLRRAAGYLDPEPWLGRWRTRARLVPLDGTPPRPAVGRLVCAAGGGTGADR